MKRTPVDFHAGLQTFRAAREMQKRRAIKRRDILAQNPDIDPRMLERVVDAQIKQDRVWGK